MTIQDLTEEERTGPTGNFMIKSPELLASLTDRVIGLRQQIALLNREVSDVYEEARQSDVGADLVRYLVSEITMPIAKREERDDRDFRREQALEAYRQVKAEREARKSQAPAESEAA